MAPEIYRKTMGLLEDCIKQRDAVPGIRVGDYIRLPRLDPRVPEFDRLTMDLGDRFQTGGLGGSFYFAGSYMSYSGGLDPGVSSADLIPSDELRAGPAWIFASGVSQGGNAVTFDVPCRVFQLRDGADLAGLWSCEPPWRVKYYTPAGYSEPKWVVEQRRGYDRRLFDTEDEFVDWAGENGFMVDVSTPEKPRILWVPA